jgi:RNA polymerase subunit RPABC4/transcription elongation factor Spt4
MSDWWNQPMDLRSPEPGEDVSGAQGAGPATCPWCSAVVPADRACCPGCGAVIAQRESLGGLVIPGVTDVDAGLSEPSLVGSALGTQARMNALGAVGQAGGTTAQLIGAAALLAKDSLGAMLREPVRPEDVGRPSQAALDMASRLGIPVQTAMDQNAVPEEAKPKQPA